MLEDESAGVCVAAAQSLCELGEVEIGLPELERRVADPNLVVDMYAIRGLEQIGEAARPALPTISAARQSKDEFTRRIANRLVSTMSP